MFEQQQTAMYCCIAVIPLSKQNTLGTSVLTVQTVQQVPSAELPIPSGRMCCALCVGGCVLGCHVACLIVG